MENIKEEIPLTYLKSNERAKIVKLDEKDVKVLRKFAVFGVFPGVYIDVLQRYPSFLLQIGFTQFAVDKEIADAIYIRPAIEENTPESTEVTSQHHMRTGGRFGRGFGRWWSRIGRRGKV